LASDGVAEGKKRGRKEGLKGVNQKKGRERNKRNEGGKETEGERMKRK
jgi:hypothetical protein